MVIASAYQRAPEGPTYSPDGRLAWDGHAWIPVAEAGPRKSIALAFVASFIITGLGTMLAERFLKGLALLVIGNGAALVAIVYSQQLSPGINCGADCTSYRWIAVASAGFALLTWLYGLADAIASVRRWNRRHGWTH